MAIKSFGGPGSADIAHGIVSRDARAALPLSLHSRALEKLIILDAACQLGDLAAWPGLHLEKLKGDRSGQYSIRINRKYRICFRWLSGNSMQVEIVDYH